MKQLNTSLVWTVVAAVLAVSSMIVMQYVDQTLGVVVYLLAVPCAIVAHILAGRDDV